MPLSATTEGAAYTRQLTVENMLGAAGPAFEEEEVKEDDQVVEVVYVTE